MVIWLKNLTPVSKNLKKEGFKKVNGKETLTKKLENNLEIILEISDDFSKIIVDIIDTKTNEKFQPFYLNNNSSSYLAKIKKEINTLIEKVERTCFVQNDIKSRLVDYCKKTFDSIVENPWEKWPEYKTIKAVTNERWYAVFLNIPLNKLDQKNLSNEEIDVLNLKLDPEKIKNLIDNINYFEGYHMNHKYWISIYLNSKLDLLKVEKLIHQSYEIVTKNRKTPK